jgi:hypothetical protein
VSRPLRLATILGLLTGLALSAWLPGALACNPPPTAAKIASLPTQYPRFNRALHVHFGRAWKEAAIVSWKEGTWHWWASNGCYQGTFQMGCGERRRWGHTNTLAGQAAAAARYWRDSGRDWSPWQCKP